MTWKPLPAAGAWAYEATSCGASHSGHIHGASGRDEALNAAMAKLAPGVRWRVRLTSPNGHIETLDVRLPCAHHNPYE